MAFSFVVDNTEGGLINTLFPVISTALSLQPTVLGLLTSISRFARMLAGPFWAVLAGLSQNFTQLLIVYSIGVIGTVASEPIANGWLADLFEEQRGKAYGALRFIGGLASLLITPAIGLLANIENGWRYGLYSMGAMSIFSGILLFVQEPKRQTALDDAGRFNLRAAAILFKTPTILLLAVNLLFITSLVLFAFFVTYFVRMRGWTNAHAIFLYTTFFAGFGIKSFLGDRFDKRFGPGGRVMLMQLYLVAFAVMSFVALHIDGEQGWTLYVILLVFGLIGSIGFSGCVLPMVSAVVPPEISATAFAVLALGYLGETFGLQNVMLWMVTVPYAINAVFWFVFYRVSAWLTHYAQGIRYCLRRYFLRRNLCCTRSKTPFATSSICPVFGIFNPIPTK